MSKTPIPDLERKKFYVEGNVAYMRVRQDALIDDGSVSSTPIPDLERNSFYEDQASGNSYRRIIVGGFSSIHTELIEDGETVFVPVNHQYLINGQIRIDGVLTLDGAIAVS